MVVHSNKDAVQAVGNRACRGGIGTDEVALDTGVGSSAAADNDARRRVSRDDVSGAELSYGITRGCSNDVHAIEVVADCEGSTGIGADEITLNGVCVGCLDRDAASVVGDDVSHTGEVSSDEVVARRVK